MRLTSPVETLDRTFSHVSAASISNCGMRSQNDAELWLIGPRPGDHATSETGTVFVFPATVTCTVSWPVWRALAGSTRSSFVEPLLLVFDQLASRCRLASTRVTLTFAACDNRSLSTSAGFALPIDTGDGGLTDTVVAFVVVPIV